VELTAESVSSACQRSIDGGDGAGELGPATPVALSEPLHSVSRCLPRRTAVYVARTRLPRRSCR